jgi:hypothetical protein
MVRDRDRDCGGVTLRLTVTESFQTIHTQVLTAVGVTKLGPPPGRHDWFYYTSTT